jgi:hypothetical protein
MNKVVAALGGALVLALVVIAFLLGRESQRGPAPPTVSSVAAPILEHPRAAPPAPPPPAAAPNVAPPAPAPAPAAPPAAPTPAAAAVDDPSGAAPPPTRGASPEQTERAALRAYLAVVDSIQVGPAGDPQAFAQELANAAMGGDTSRLDALVRELGDAESKVAAVSPPGAAAAHHGALLAQLRQSRAVLSDLSRGLARKDPSILGRVAGQAQSMQAAATALEREDKQLRARL